MSTIPGRNTYLPMDTPYYTFYDWTETQRIIEGIPMTVIITIRGNNNKDTIKTCQIGNNRCHGSIHVTFIIMNKTPSSL